MATWWAVGVAVKVAEVGADWATHSVEAGLVVTRWTADAAQETWAAAAAALVLGMRVGWEAAAGSAVAAAEGSATRSAVAGWAAAAVAARTWLHP